MKATRPVLIVGAGPTGLTAAMELSRFGVPVRIVDKAPAASTTSKALALQARTLELLSQREVLDEMLRLGNRVTAVHLHSNRKRLASIHLGSIPSRFNFVLLLPQNETERILAGQLSKQGVAVERSTEVVGLTQTDGQDCVQVVLRHADGRLEEVETPYVVCAEGAHSNIRHTANLEFKGKSLPTVYALADLHIDGDLPEDALSIFLAEKGFLGLFPMGGHRFRMIATDREEHGEDAGQPTVLEMQKLYDAETHIPATLRDPLWTARFKINSRMMDTFRAGRLFFGGDSAHIHSPAGGQGMNTGIQDMVNLGWKLALVYHGQANLDLLDTYTDERLPVIKNLVGTTEKATDTMTSTNPIVHQFVTHLLPLALDFEAIQKRGARVLSQVGIEYRESTLSETRSAPGQLRGGDRVPDLQVSIGDGAETVPLYSLLDPSAFTLLVTGGIAPIDADGTASIKVVHVHAPADSEDRQSFLDCFGAGEGLFAVRPDAYVGFAGGGNDVAELGRWFRSLLGTDARSQGAG